MERESAISGRGKGAESALLMLSPMAGVTDAAFRSVCASFGARRTVTEMVSAKALCFGSKKTLALAAPFEGERGAVQIFGSEPECMAKAAALLMRLSPAAIDVNMGCPVPKCVKNGEGAALMKDPALCGRIVAAIKRAVPVPVTVKMRTGFDEAHKNAVEVALRAEDAGASLICIHGRTRVQMYSGSAEHETAAAVKRAVSLPVIISGDVRDGECAKKVLAETNCDGVAVGRAALGRPWVFAEIAAALEGRGHSEPSPEEKYAAVCRHFRGMEQIKGSVLAALEARKHLAWYSKGLRSGAAIRRKACEVKSIDEALSLARALFAQAGS